MNAFRYLLAVSATLLVFSCGEKNIPTTEPQPEVKIPIKLSVGQWTKANDNSFEWGDQVGLYVVNQGSSLSDNGNHVNNMRFTLNDSWVPDQEIYWASQTTPASFYCYYPYNSAVTSTSSYAFRVSTDQSTEEGYKSSELLWGKTENVTPSESPVGIIVRHEMSNLIIVLKPGKGYTESELNYADVKISGLAVNAKVNLADGQVSATGAPQDITPKKENGYYRALVVPQTVNDVALVKITIDGYQYTLNQSMTFVANKQHTCTITIDKTSNGINIGIGSWETDDQDYGGTIS